MTSGASSQRGVILACEACSRCIGLEWGFAFEVALTTLPALSFSSTLPNRRVVLVSSMHHGGGNDILSPGSIFVECFVSALSLITPFTSTFTHHCWMSQHTSDRYRGGQNSAKQVRNYIGRHRQKFVAQLICSSIHNLMHYYRMSDIDSKPIVSYYKLKSAPS